MDPFLIFSLASSKTSMFKYRKKKVENYVHIVRNVATKRHTLEKYLNENAENEIFWCFLIILRFPKVSWLSNNFDQRLRFSMFLSWKTEFHECL